MLDKAKFAVQMTTATPELAETKADTDDFSFLPSFLPSERKQSRRRTDGAEPRTYRAAASRDIIFHPYPHPRPLIARNNGSRLLARSLAQSISRSLDTAIQRYLFTYVRLRSFCRQEGETHYITSAASKAGILCTYFPY